MTTEQLEILSNRLMNYCKRESLPYLSADELIHEDITQAQRKWLSQFILEWEEAELTAY